MEQYPAVAFIVRHGKPLAWIIGVLPPVLASALLYAAGLHWLWSLLALALSPLLYLIARSYAELVAIVADMLLPK